MNVAVRIGQTKRRTAKIGCFYLHRQQRQRLFQNCVDHRLIVRNAVIDNIVKIVIVLEIHAIKIVSILVISKLLNAAEGLDSGEIQSKKRKQGEYNDRQNRQQNDQYTLLHFIHVFSPFQFGIIL